MKKYLKIMGMVLLTLGIVWFLLPLIRAGFGIGSIFGIVLCGLGAFLILFYNRIAKSGGVKKACIRFIGFFYVVGVLWCGYLSILMGSAKFQLPPEDANLIVLGAQVHENGQLSLSLGQRVNRAGAYLTEHPQRLCITTGGQGGNEPITEALAEKNRLVEMGIDPERIFLEDRSRNTRENFENAAELIEAEQLGENFAVVTQEFHMYRSLQLGKAAGLQVYALPVKSDPLMYPGYFGRELLSLTKWHAEELFRKEN